MSYQQVAFKGFEGHIEGFLNFDYFCLGGAPLQPSKSNKLSCAIS